MIDVFLGLAFNMAAAHALCDFPLQPGLMSAAKRPGAVPTMPWPFALGCHALIHGGAVSLLTGVWWLGAAETVAHALVDGAKCRGAFGMKTDQALHLSAKLLWAAIAVAVGS